MSIRCSFLFLCNLFITCNAFSQADDSITLLNNFDHSIYVAFYTPSGKRGDHKITLVPAQGKTTINRPEKKIFIPTASLLLAAKALDDLPGNRTLPLDAVTSAEVSVGKNPITTITFNTLGNDHIGATAQERSDTISVTNTTNKKLFVGLYYSDGAKSRRWGSTVLLAPGTTKIINRPERKCKNSPDTTCTAYYDRTLYVAPRAETLQPEIPHKTASFFNVGSLNGDIFYVYEEKGTLSGAPEIVWKTKTARSDIEAILKQNAETVRSYYTKMKYQGKNETATVRRGTDLSPQEQAFLHLRKGSHVKPACKDLYLQLFKEDMPATTKIPTIAFCLSGGGCRALLTTTGFIAEAERRKLLPLFSYSALLSGSTWGYPAWLISGLSAADYNSQLIQQLTPGITRSASASHLQDALLKKQAFKEYISLIDIYGCLLAHALLKPYAPHGNPNRLFWAEALQPRVNNAEVPYPLFSAVTPRQFSDLDVSKDHYSDYYSWVTFDPYEISIHDHALAIPAWALGRTFKEGKAPGSQPPQSIGFCMGIFGSAMSINMADAIRVGVGAASAEMATKIMNIVVQEKNMTLFSQQRVSPAKVPNFVKEEGMMTLVDAGVSLNLPFPPLLQKERAADIIIVVDASAILLNAPTLLHAERYCKDHKLPFPRIDQKKLNQPFSIFWDKENKQAPVIIYIPLAGGLEYESGWNPNDHIFTLSTNFSYTPRQAELLSGCGAFMCEFSAAAIQQVIGEWLREHQS